MGLLAQAGGHADVSLDVFRVLGQFQVVQADPGVFLDQGQDLGPGLQAVRAALRPVEPQLHLGLAAGARLSPG